jgi:predicted branched-subunit amino acid permease
LDWTTVAGVAVSIIECKANGDAQGDAAVALTFTDKNFVVTAGAAQTIYKGATVATTGAQTANWYCWAAGTQAGTVTCGTVSDKTDFGVSGCSAVNPSTLTLTWTTVAGTHVAIKECSAADTAAGEEVDVVFTDKNFVVTAGASQTIEKGAAVAISGVQTANWLCWKAGTAAGTVTCGVKSDKTDIGLTGCSAAAPTSLTWTTLAGIHVAIKECSAASTAAGVEVDIVLTEANIAITGGAAQDLVAGAALVVTELGSGRHLCWKSGTSASAIDTCLAAGTATDAGATGCGAVDVASLAWTTVAGTHVSIIQCEGTTKKGSAVATVLTEQIVVASQNITAGSIVTVAGLTTGNHLCWTAGTVAGAATCAAAGTTVDLGITGCGAADDNTIAWTTTSKDYIAIRECKATSNANVGAEVDLVLGVTTTAAPTPTTTVSGASSEAAWSTMLTVFAIAMAAFSTL